MNVLFVLVPLALLIAGIAVALFIWAVRSGQYDDLDTPAVRILFDEAPSGAEVPQDTKVSSDSPVSSGTQEPAGIDPPPGGDQRHPDEISAPGAPTPEAKVGRSQPQ